MELKEAIEERRSIRKYLDREVDKNLVSSILEEGTHAPSAHNRQHRIQRRLLKKHQY